MRNSDSSERVSTTTRRNGSARGKSSASLQCIMAARVQSLQVRRDDFPLDGLDSLGLAAGIFQKLEAGPYRASAGVRAGR